MASVIARCQNGNHMYAKDSKDKHTSCPRHRDPKGFKKLEQKGNKK